jgi:S-ribosylhomocysteine lyase
MTKVESFTLDHNAVQAPYVRLIEEQAGPNGGSVANYDVRFVQPNQQEIPTGAIHTLEHLLAANLRDRLDGIIDISPFGCRTGFHLISWHTYSAEEVARALTQTLALIVEELEWVDVPATTAKECGNYRDHSLWGAKEWSRQVLEQGISDDPFERHVVK